MPLCHPSIHPPTHPPTQPPFQRHDPRTPRTTWPPAGQGKVRGQGAADREPGKRISGEAGPCRVRDLLAPDLPVGGPVPGGSRKLLPCWGRG